MKLSKLSLKDKEIFLRYLNLTSHELSVYAFEDIYIWSSLFDIQWAIIEDCFCIFFKDKISCFLYLAPLGKNTPWVVGKAFEIMDGFNKNKDISRIENVEDKDVKFYRDLGFDCQLKSYDYLCLRSDLVNLGGKKFKSKRACFNYFLKHNQFEYQPFSLEQTCDCLKLYRKWKEQREVYLKDSFYQRMLKDNLKSLKVALSSYKDLNLKGKIVKVAGRIKAFSFGYKLNSETFCILYEITDLSIKGLAQFIFREFCRELADYKYINIMDDSGLENLKKVKLSYHPIKLIPAYIVKRSSCF
jgi:hypothetical protein